MRDDVQARIHDAAQDAFGATWDQSVVPQGVHSGGLYSAMMAVEDHAHAASHEAVRAECASLGVDPRDYYRVDPGSAVICEPACLETWPEISVAVTLPDPDADFLVRRDTERILTDSAPESAVEDYAATESETEDCGFQSGLGY